ncbi:MAG: ABC transporter ATP-binding protein [Rhodocyclaceae bacterium]|nr:ABC transporter ATP-binding protein [Rhodocyclaceae bacterium]
MTAAIAIDTLCKTYPRSLASPPFEALKGISLTVDEGEVFGFIGPNGAGKSTAIKILTGVMSQTSGSAKLFGIEVDRPESRSGLGYVPENPSLPDYLTPLEILTMGLALHGRKPADAKRHCMQWLARFGLDHVANKVVRGFSKGMAQRTALAHALAVQPRLLILDEPLSGLDPVGRRDVVDILSEFRDQGGTVFLTSHVLHDVERIADRFGLIHKGDLLTIRSPQEIVADQADRYVVHYRGNLAIAAATEVRAGLYAVNAHAADLASVVAQIQAAGAIVQNVQPAISLETVFFRTIGEPARTGA